MVKSDLTLRVPNQKPLTFSQHDANIERLAYWSGDWSAGTYTQYEMVKHVDNTWICVAVSTTDEPSDSSADWVRLAPVIDEFVELIDTPSDYTNAANQMVVVNGTEDGLIFQPQPTVYDEFTDLTDTPANYTGAANQMVVVNGTETALEFVDQPVIPPTYDEFTDLIDTPANYTGAANQMVVVNGTADGLIFQPQPTVYDEFTDLTDTPANYTGAANQMVVVNGTATGLEFVDQPVIPPTYDEFTDLIDTPSTYAGANNYLVSVNAGATGLEFTPAPAIYDEFTDLIDTPANYTDAANQMVVVNGTADGLIFQPQPPVIDEFTELIDTPSDYTGSGGQLVAVNTGETALEFIPPSGMQWLSDWSAGTYNVDEVVKHEGGVYIALQTTTAIPGRAPTDWELITPNPGFGQQWLGIVDAGPDISFGWTPITQFDTNTGTANGTQFGLNGEFTLSWPGLWEVDLQSIITFNELQSGRNAYLRLYDITDGAQIGRDVPWYVARSVVGHQLILTFYVNLSPDQIGHSLRLEIGNGDDFTSVVWQSNRLTLKQVTSRQS